MLGRLYLLPRVLARALPPADARGGCRDTPGLIVARGVGGDTPHAMRSQSAPRGGSQWGEVRERAKFKGEGVARMRKGECRGLVRKREEVE